MWNFLETYAPQIALFVAIVGPALPLIRKRLLSDKNLLKIFGDVKELASKVEFKEFDIKQALIKVDTVQDNIQRKLDDYQLMFDNKMIKVDQAITNFMDSDLYQKMLNGLAQVDQLVALLESKDTTIQELGSVIKDMNKNYLEIKNLLKKG